MPRSYSSRHAPPQPKDRPLTIPLVPLLLAALSGAPPAASTSVQIDAGLASSTLDDDLLVGVPVGLQLLHRRDRFWLGAAGRWQDAANRGASDVRPIEAVDTRLELDAGWTLWRWRALDVRADADAAWIRTSVRRSAWSGMVPGADLPATTSVRHDATVGLDVAIRLASATGGPGMELVPLACETGTRPSCSARLAAGWTF